MLLALALFFAIIAGSCAAMAIAGSEGEATIYPRPLPALALSVTEDSAGFNCHRHGNHRCGTVAIYVDAMLRP